MNVLLCVAATAALLVASNLAIDCSNNRCTTRGFTHTMCKYPTRSPGLACGQVSSMGFTATEKTEIISKHNELRQKVATGKERRGNPGPQAKAYIMNIVFWDDELAGIAQRWANQCSLGNDDCRDVDRFAVGQNSAMMLSSGDKETTPSDVLMMWYNEVKDMDAHQVNTLASVENVSHYTQMVWGDTGVVGCGKIVYQAGGWNMYYMVCNYGPAGNWIGQPVYLADSFY